MLCTGLFQHTTSADMMLTDTYTNPGARRAPATTIRKKQLISGNGQRHSYLPQADVNITAELQDDYRIRSMQQDQFYPLGSKQIHHVQMGELAFQYATPTGAPDRFAIGMILQAFSCFNGLPYYPRLRFVGVVSAAAGDTLGEILRDKTFPVTISGTATTFNTGEHHIAAGDTVVWGPPLFNVDASGTKRPRVSLTGFDNTRFVASVHPLNAETVDAVVARFIFKCFAAASECYKKDTDDYGERVDELLAGHGLSDAVGEDSAFPFGLYTQEEQQVIHRRNLVGDPLRRLAGIIGSIAGVTTDLFSASDTTATGDQYDASIGSLDEVTSMASTGDIKNPTISSDGSFATSGMRTGFDEVVAVIKAGTEGRQITAMNASMFGAVVVSATAAAVCQLHRIYKSRVIGTAILPSSPGERLYILVGRK